MRLLLTLLFISFLFWGHAQICDGCKIISDPNKDDKSDVIPGKAVVLYSNDFSNPSQWSFSNTSVPSADWVITSNLNAAPINAFIPAGFLTAFNGFAFINSDAQGPNATQDAIISLNTIITACATKPYVLVRFSQMLRRFGDTTLLEVSNNGTTWSSFLCNPTLENNDNTPNPDKVDINISSVAGNQDTVYLRFRYKASNAWFWAIDDLKVLEQDEFDLEGLETTYGTMGNWGIKMPYPQTTLAQIQPIEISGRIKNAGYGPQFGVFIESTNGGTYTSASDTITLSPNLSATLDIIDQWTPNAVVGNQTINTTVFSPATDQEPGNDQLTNFSVNISPKYYARSTDIRTGRVSNNFSQYGYETGNIFDIFSDAVITSAMVHVNAESTPGSLLFARLYEAVAPDSFLLLSISDTIVLPSLTIDQVFRVRLIDPTLLQSGKSYLLTAGSIGSPTFPGLVIGTSGKSALFTSYYLGENTIGWFQFTETPMVKMNFESVADLSEFENDMLFALYPNPNDGAFTVKFNEPITERTFIEIYSIQGELLNREEITLSTGETSVQIDRNGLAEGAYFVRIINNYSNQSTKVFVKNSK
jgi:Secretion system C-terminal sorting domain